MEAKDPQEKIEGITKIQETVKKIESNLASGQTQVLEEAKEITDSNAMWQE